MVWSSTHLKDANFPTPSVPGMHRTVIRIWSFVDAAAAGSTIASGLSRILYAGVMKTGGTGAPTVAGSGTDLVVTGPNNDEDGIVTCIGEI